MSKIEWTGKTWNPVVGCDKVSPGCKNCYAITMANRLMHMPGGKEKYAGTVKKTDGGALNWTGKINLHEGSLLIPLQKKKPELWFVNSMSDLFHDKVPFDFIDKVFAVMALCPQHTFQILTKRAERMAEYFDDIAYRTEMIGIEAEHIGGIDRHMDMKPTWPLPLPNVWIGVSVENQKAANERIPPLLKIPAAIRWLSCEPLLGAVDFHQTAKVVISKKYEEHRFFEMLEDDNKPIGWASLDGDYTYCDLEGIDWVVAGFESGNGARPGHPDWARSLRDQCKAAEIPFFFKQWGEWAPVDEVDPSEDIVYLQADGYKERAKPIQHMCINHDGAFSPVADEVIREGEENCIMYKFGKHLSGRKLDGVEWMEYPKTKIDSHVNVKCKYCKNELSVFEVQNWEDCCEECIHREFEDDSEPERKCRECGCSEFDACVHPEHGPCWWVEDDLCSHCKLYPVQSKRDNIS